METEIQTSTPTEATPAPSMPATPSTPASSASQAPAPSKTTQAPSAPSQVIASSEPAPYQPSYKFVVGKDEKEFDEWARPWVKSKEDEDRLRDLYTKAHGLDSVKARHKETQNYLQAERSEKEQLKSFYSELDGYVNKRDFQAFIERTGIPEDLVLEWVKQRLEYQEMDPQKKYAYDREREFRKNSYAESARLSQLETQNRQILAQQRNFELDAALSKPGIAELQKAYDEMAQRQGIPTFRDEIIRRGQAHAVLTKGEDIPPDVLTSQMEKMFGHIVPKAQPVAPTTAVNGKPPVIPHVGGGNTSPVEKGVKTLADLEKLREERLAGRRAR